MQEGIGLLLFAGRSYAVFLMGTVLASSSVNVKAHAHLQDMRNTSR